MLYKINVILNLCLAWNKRFRINYEQMIFLILFLPIEGSGELSFSAFNIINRIICCKIVGIS